MERTWAANDEWLSKRAAGDSEFERELRDHIGATQFMMRLPRSYRVINRPPLAELFPVGLPKNERNSLMLRAHVMYAYSMADIANALCMHPGSVSRVVASIRRKMRSES